LGDGRASKLDTVHYRTINWFEINEVGAVVASNVGFESSLYAIRATGACHGSTGRAARMLKRALNTCRRPSPGATPVVSDTLIWVSDRSGLIVSGVQKAAQAVALGLPGQLKDGYLSANEGPDGDQLTLMLQVHGRRSCIFHSSSVGSLRLMASEDDGLTVWMFRRVSDELSRLLSDLVIALDLTARETTVAELMCRNLSEAKIASLLGVSAETVRSHRRNIYHKLQVEDRAGFILQVAAHMLA
jgi:DNA-binding CsgD family transcriptional regulator